MTSPIADAAFAALAAWQGSEERKAQVISAARAALAPILPGVNLTGLETRVEDQDVVVVSDGVVTLLVTTDGKVHTGNRNGPGWTRGKTVKSARELGEALPSNLKRGGRA